MNFILVYFLVAASVLQSDPTSFHTYSTSLSVGECFAFDGKEIRFKKVISDSRCPKGVTCIWAGEARVLVEVFEGGKLCGEEILTISGGSEAVSLQHLFPDQVLQLARLVLVPYPEVVQKTKPEDYRLSLEVRLGQEE